MLHSFTLCKIEARCVLQHPGERLTCSVKHVEQVWQSRLEFLLEPKTRAKKTGLVFGNQHRRVLTTPKCVGFETQNCRSLHDAVIFGTKV